MGKHNKFSEDSIELICKLYNEGKTSGVISEITGININSTKTVLRRSNVVLRGIQKKFTEEQEIEIVEQYKLGKTSGELRIIWSVSGTQLRRILGKFKVLKNLSESHRKYTLNQDVFSDAANDPEAAYWVGFLMADGCIIDKNLGANRVSLSLSQKDSDQIEKFRKFINTNCPTYKNKPSGFGLSGGKGTIHVGVSSQKMVDDLAKYGVVPRKSATAKVKLLEDNVHFWRGMVDGDGYIYFRKNKPFIGFCGSPNSVEQFSNFVHSVTVWENKPTVYKYERDKISSVEIQGTRAVQLINCLYNNDGTSLDRKKEKAKIGMLWVSKKK